MKAACVFGLLLVAGCDRSVRIGDNGRPGTLQQVVTQDLDLLFMVDDSSSMTTVQQNLAVNFPRLIDQLQQLPGGLPNVHIGIVTSSMGAGGFTSSVPGCTSPDLGHFITNSRNPTDPSTCSVNTLNAGEHFFTAGNGATANYTGDLATAFGCIAQVGANGCGFEQPLASVEAAIGPNAPPDDAGFLRADAYLGIILITNEDDCSAPNNTLLFDPSQNSIGDPLGPLASYRCTEFGILCDGQSPPRMAAGPLSNCVSNDARAATDPLHSLTPIQHFIDFTRGLKSVQDHTLVSLIGGPAQPFATTIDPQTGFPALAHSCTSQSQGTPDAGVPDASPAQMIQMSDGGFPDASPPPIDALFVDAYPPPDAFLDDSGTPPPPPSDFGAFADPAVRLSQFLQAFGGHFVSICDDTYAGALIDFGNQMRDALDRQCVGQDLAMASNPSQRLPRPSDGALVDPSQVSCSLVHVSGVGTGSLTEMEPIPPCANASGRCYQLVGDTHCLSGVHVSLCDGSTCANRVTLPPSEGALLRCAAILPE